MNSSETDWIGMAKTFTADLRNFLGGRRTSIGDAAEVSKFSPRDGHLLYRVGVSRTRDIDDAVAQARAAFEDGRWSRMPLMQRKDRLHRLATLIEEHKEELALRETLDVGKPIRDALSFDVPAAAAIVKYSAEAADKAHSRVYSADHHNLSFQLRRPVGVVAGIIGWNFPLMLAAEKIAPSLAVGNSLVLKPSELTSLSAARLAELAVEAGIPEGVFSVVHGDATVGVALAQHRDVDLLTFTGSTHTGKKLLIASGESNMKRLILECGGKAPNIVFEDCPDLDDVADSIVERAFWNQGQVCTASSRLLIQRGVKDTLLRRIIERVSALRPEDPLKWATTFGAVVSHSHRQKISSYVESGERDGAKVAYRGEWPVPFKEGFYASPVIFDEVSPSQRIAQEEIFGPVVSVITFADELEAIKIANATIYGLSAILWTKDLGRAHRMTHGIRAGWIVVNGAPKRLGGPGPGVLSIGGHKESGIGVEGGIAGLEGYTTQTAVQMFV